MRIEIAVGKNAEEASQPQNKCVHLTETTWTCPCCHRVLSREDVAWMMLKETQDMERKFTQKT